MFNLNKIKPYKHMVYSIDGTAQEYRRWTFDVNNKFFIIREYKDRYKVHLTVFVGNRSYDYNSCYSDLFKLLEDVELFINDKIDRFYGDVEEG